jgi:phosphoribosylformylglycinamidine (FGAM) synthase-like amidotransferase family enzyme
MAHGDGNYFADDATLDRLEARAWSPSATPRRRRDSRRRQPQRQRARIAGIYSPNLRMLGLMPHPEDLVDPLMGGTDGKPLFDGLAMAWRRRMKTVDAASPAASA